MERTKGLIIHLVYAPRAQPAASTFKQSVLGFENKGKIVKAAYLLEGTVCNPCDISGVDYLQIYAQLAVSYTLSAAGMLCGEESEERPQAHPNMTVYFQDYAKLICIYVQPGKKAVRI